MINDAMMTKNYCILFLLISSYSYAQIEKTPCSRNQPVIAYHEKENSIFLFGGFCSSDKRRLNDLWAYDGQAWIPMLTESAPPARSGHSMIYDSYHNRLLVFGGKNDNGNLLNDLWSWDGQRWKQLNGEGPEARQSHRMIFNSKNGNALLFGGSNIDGKALNDTWVFKNETWVKLESKSQPSPRLQHTMSYDLARDVIVLFGGFNRNNGDKQIFGDTWEWHPSKGWLLKADEEQIARDHHAMAYDIQNKRTILFGGYNQGYLADTRCWDGKKWEKLSTDDSLARAGKPGFVYDLYNETLVLFGGWDKNNVPLMDFWRFNYNRQSWNKY